MSALPRFSIGTYSDACKQERGLLGWDQRYTQMSRGRFEGFVAHMDFGRVSLSEERLNVSVAQNTAPPHDKVVLVLPAPSRDSRINGVQCDGPGFLHMGGHEISIITAETTKGYYVTVAEKDLWGLDRRRTGPLCSIEAYPGAAELSNWIASLMSTAPDALRRSPRELSAVLPDLIIDRISDLCTFLSARDHKPLTESYAQSVVRKARRIMEAQSRDQLSITQLAQALDLPSHVLRGAFMQAAGGQSPHLVAPAPAEPSAPRNADTRRGVEGCGTDRHGKRLLPPRPLRRLLRADLPRTADPDHPQRARLMRPKDTEEYPFPAPPLMSCPSTLPFADARVLSHDT